MNMNCELAITVSNTAGADDMRRVVGVNEEIKGVVRVARALSVEAINAMLAARRAGMTVRGFAVVSIELRAFSGKLQALMDELAGDLADLVRAVAKLSKDLRRRRHLTTALTMSGDSPMMAASLGRIDLVLACMALANAKVWRRVRRVIAQALRLCDVGRALARGAKIEAVYGGALSAQLSQVGEVIERTIEQIRQQLCNASGITGVEA